MKEETIEEAVGIGTSETWRTLEEHHTPINSRYQITQFQSQTPQTATTLFTSFKLFHKKPHALPFLLTWVSLRYQRRYNAGPSFRHSLLSVEKTDRGYFKDSNTNLVKFSASSSLVMMDKHGWLIDPVSIALDAALPGGAVSCNSVHLGEIRPGTMRGNHRHHTCNETLIIWVLRQCTGWKTKQWRNDTRR